MAEDDEMACDTLPMSMTMCATDDPRQSTALIVAGLRPRQIQAATLLVQGQQGKRVAAMLNVSPETISRWRQQVAFQHLMQQLLREHIDSVQLGMIALTTEAIGQLHNLINGFSDRISLQACSLVLNRAAPVLGIIGTELRRPSEVEQR